jgi:hypothetical protein
VNGPLRWAVGAVLGVMVLTSSAGAATSKDAAREYNEKAKAAFDAGDFETAADQFTRALELFPEPRIRLNLGVAMENLGRLDDARDHYEAFLRAFPRGPKSDAVRDKMRTLDRLMKERGKVIITVDPPPDEVTVAGVTFRRLRPVKVWLAPGKHQVTARREGYAPLEREVTVESGAAAEVVLQLRPKDAAASPGAVVDGNPPAGDPRPGTTPQAATSPTAVAAPAAEPPPAAAPVGEATPPPRDQASQQAQPATGGSGVLRWVLGGGGGVMVGAAALALVGVAAALATAGTVVGAWQLVVGMDRYRMPLNVGLWVALGAAGVAAVLVPLLLLGGAGLGAGAVFAG